MLTIFRVLAIPAVVSSFYLDYLWAQYLTLVIFVTAAITDFFDGYLARMWGVQSKFGRIFDPAADKLIVLSTLVMLVYTGKVSGLSVILVVAIVCREVLVSCMREFLVAANISVPVSDMGKLKTFIQILAISTLILDCEFTACIGEICLFLAAATAVYSMYLYTRDAMTKIGNNP